MTQQQRAAILAEVRQLTNSGKHQQASALWLRYFSPIR